MDAKHAAILVDASPLVSMSSARLNESPPRSLSREGHASQKAAYAAPKRASMAKPYFDSQYRSDW